MNGQFRVVRLLMPETFHLLRLTFHETGLSIRAICHVLLQIVLRKATSKSQLLGI